MNKGTCATRPVTRGLRIRKYDVWCCLSQPEDIDSLNLFVKIEYMKVYEGGVP